MANMYKLAGLALLGLAAWAGSASAQVVIRVPFVSVDVMGPNVHVRAPGVIVDVRGHIPAGGVVIGPLPPGYVMPAPAPVVTPAPPADSPKPRNVTPVEPPAPAAGKAMPVSQFVSTFSPEAGKHTVALVHPATGEAVTVQFTLPEGCRKVNFDGNKKVVFDCGDKEVAIRFLSSGAVKVDYLD